LLQASESAIGDFQFSLYDIKIMRLTLLNYEHVIRKHDSILVQFAQGLESRKDLLGKLFLDEAHLLLTVFNLRQKGVLVAFGRFDYLVVLQKFVVSQTVFQHLFVDLGTRTHNRYYINSIPILWCENHYEATCGKLQYFL
jgi:hypothetical protein